LSPIRNPARHWSKDDLLAQLPRLVHKSAQVNFLAKYPEFSNAETVVWLADLIRDQSKVDTASVIPLAELALRIARKLRDKSTLARGLRAMGNALYISGDNKSAIAFHEKARRMFSALRNRIEFARTLSASTQPLILTGQYRRALSNAKRARSIFSSWAEHGRVARLDVNIGNIFHRQDRFVEALKWYRRAFRYFSADVEKDPEGTSVALHNIAMCLVSVNDFHGALAAHQETGAIAKKYGLHVLVGQADYNIAELYYLRGEYRRAIGLLLSTREACRKANDRYHIALCNLDLSEIYVELNLAAPAEEMAQAAAAGFQKLEMGYEAGKSLVNKALAMAQQKKPAEALEMLATARLLFIKESNSVWPFLTDLYQASILLEQNRYLEAKRFCLTAKKYFKTAHIPGKLVQCRLLLAQCYLQAGNSRLAKQECSVAITVLNKVRLPLLLCRAHQLMGRIELAEGSYHEAYRHYQAARSLLEETRSDLHNEEMKMSFMEDKLEIYEGLTHLCLEPKRGDPDLEEAFKHVEESKSRILQDLMSLSETADSHSNSHGEDQRETIDLRAQINWYSHKLLQEQVRGSKASQKIIADLQEEIHKRENKVLRIIREMPVSEAIAAGLVSSKPAALEEIRQSLPAGSTLVEYFQVQDRLMVALLTNAEFKILPATQIQLVEPSIQKLQYQFAKFRLGQEYANTFGESLLSATRHHLKELHDKLLAPIEEHLRGQHLVIVPHGPLHRLPFQALFDGKDYLIDKFSISYSPSATIHALCHRRPVNKNGPALVLGVPDAAAPLIEDEAAAIAKTIPGAVLFLGRNATTDLLREKGPGCRFIHIATHGYFRQDNPMFSGIRLGDSMLSLIDLYRLRLPVELITLSGCATGANTVTKGDELLGLVRGLVYAGAKAALLSLWDVHDRSTLEFMTTFYRHLMEGTNQATSLQKAAQSVRDGYPHPYYWAAFSLVGNIT
jgi:CHAT domain-containing protein